MYTIVISSASNVVIVINRIIQTYTYTTAVIARSVRATWQSPGREMSETNTRQPARPRWLTAERSEPSGG